jgi:predicted oxidoreductase (fatty acid repression mutant protein)
MKWWNSAFNAQGSTRVIIVIVKESKEILLNLSMKCWNSAFNAQGSARVIIVNCLGRSTENICSSSGGAPEKGKTPMKFSFLPNLVEN